MNVEASLLLKSDVAPQDNLDEEQVTHTEAHPVVVNAPSDVDILVEDGGQAVKERRRSERLKKDTNLHTMDKVTRVAQKRNLVGNFKNTNSFSIVPVEEIASILADMGVIISHDDFDTFSWLKDLEQARDDLYLKQCDLKKSSQTESVENVDNAHAPLELEWLQDESSEIEDFIPVEPRKKKRGNGKVLKFLLC